MGVKKLYVVGMLVGDGSSDELIQVLLGFYHGSGVGMGVVSRIRV